MIYEDSQFIIYYNECDKVYLEKLINIIKSRMPRIVSFFQISYDEKIVIKLYDNLDKYVSNIEESFRIEAEKENKESMKYESWMIANTWDGNVNMQSLDLLVKNPGFENYTEEEFLFNACHEFTHLCQRKVNSPNPDWFWEVLATVLGNPECQGESDVVISIDKLENNFGSENGYNEVYKIGKYLFDNYDKDFILSLVYDNEKMYEVVGEVISKLNGSIIKY